jgi:fructose-bisphosphate aldolase class I
MSDLVVLAKQLVAEGKGLLAADWGADSIGKRFEKLEIANSEEKRREYREMLFTAPGLNEYLSGVIENEETVKQGLAEKLNAKGIVPGVKVDRGLVELTGFVGEKVTEGLDGLTDRLEELLGLGAKFCKWRAVFSVGNGLPSRECIKVNVIVLARYAGICQAVGMVPILEPEVVMDGGHSGEQCAKVSEQVLRELFVTASDMKVDLEGLILKTNMVVAGRDNPNKLSSQAVAELTVEVLKKTVPVEVPGVVFLSGGQEAREATENLNEIGKVRGSVPWKMTFSFERAFEEPTLNAWAGKEENKQRAQEVLVHRARMNSLASLGKYNKEEDHEI